MASKGQIVIIIILLMSGATISPLNAGGVHVSLPETDVIFMNTDWLVTGSESYLDETRVLTGNLTITGTGVLELTNVTLIMNVTGADGSYGIMVQDGGRLYVNDTDGNPLTVTDRSKIMNNATYGRGFKFQVNATSVFEMRNSRLQGSGLFGTQPGANESGPRILSDSVFIENSEITGCSNGLYIDSANPIIINSTVHVNTKNGIYYANAANPNHHFNLSLINNTINNNAKTGLYLLGNVTDIALEANYIHHNGDGGARINSTQSLNATLVNNTVQFNTGKGGIGMWGLPGLCDIRAEVIGNNISENGGVSSLLVGFEYSEPPAATVFLNASGNDIWVSGIGEDVEGDGLLLVYAQNYIHANISNNNIIGPLMANGINVGKATPEFNDNPACKVVDALVINNEIVNIKAGALKVTSTDELVANVSENHIYHPSGSMGCGSVSLGWYSASTPATTPKNATFIIRNNQFAGISDSGALGLKAIYNLNATIEGNVLGKANGVGVNEWGFRLGWIDDGDSKLNPLPEYLPTRNVRAIIRNNTINDGYGPAIWVYSSNGTSIHDNIVSKRSDGIRIQKTIGNTLVFNNRVGNGTGTGIEAYESTGVSVFNNRLDSNYYGLGVEHRSKDNIFFNNTITKPDSEYGFYVSTDSFSHAFPVNNTVNGEWFRYYHNLQGTQSLHKVITGQNIQEPLMSNLGQLVIVNGTFIDICGNYIANGQNGTSLLRSNHTFIFNNTIKNSFHQYIPTIGSGLLFGIGSHNNTVQGNGLENNLYSVKFEGSSVDNVLWNNSMIKDDSSTAIFLDPEGTTRRNTISQNNTVNGNPVLYYYQSLNVAVEDAFIEEPLMTNLGQIIVFESQNVTLSNVTVQNGTYGTYIRDSANITLDNSAFRLNECHVFSCDTDNLKMETLHMENGTSSICLNSTYLTVSNSSIDGATQYALEIVSSGSHAVFTNTSFNQTKVAIAPGSDLTVKWFLGITASVNNQPCEGATVKVTNASGTVNYEMLTGPNGFFKNLVLVDYINTSANTHMQNSYNIYVGKPGYSNFTSGIILNRSFDISVNLTDIVAPNLSQIILQPNITGTSSDFTWLNATLDDSGSGSSLIAQAEWYISTLTPTIPPGTGFPVVALDGAFDEVTEKIGSNISLENWQVGTHILWVHGMDAAGNWCAWSSAALKISDNEGPTVSWGPTLLSVTIGTSTDRIQVTAMIDDSFLGNSRIFGAEWEVIREGDVIADIYSPTSATDAADGNFDEANETVETDLDIRFWAEGSYTFRIRGFDEYDNFGEWAEIDFELIDDISPQAPSNLQATESEMTVEVTWSGNTELDLAGYNIYRSSTSGTGYVWVASVGPSITAWEDTTAEVETDYYYVITAFDDAAPPNESPYSAEAKATSEEAAGVSIVDYWWVFIIIIFVLTFLAIILTLRNRRPGKSNEPSETPVQKEYLDEKTDQE